jgi:hypothetical protein
MYCCGRHGGKVAACVRHAYADLQVNGEEVIRYPFSDPEDASLG